MYKSLYKASKLIIREVMSVGAVTEADDEDLDEEEKEEEDNVDDEKEDEDGVDEDEEEDGVDENEEEEEEEEDNVDEKEESAEDVEETFLRRSKSPTVILPSDDDVVDMDSWSGAMGAIIVSAAGTMVGTAGAKGAHRSHTVESEDCSFQIKFRLSYSAVDPCTL
jgi:hypothetical protein